MEKLKQIFSALTVVFILVGFVLGMVSGYFLFRAKAEKENEVTSRIVIDRVTKQGFLVTRSVFLDQDVVIKVDKGSDWSNFWWGQTITASASTKVDIGVDFTRLTEQDVKVDQAKKLVCIYLPAVTVQDSTITGDISVKRKLGPLTVLFANNPNQDYNQAKALIESEASALVQQRPELLTESREAAVQLLNSLFDVSGYTVSACQ